MKTYKAIKTESGKWVHWYDGWGVREIIDRDCPDIHEKIMPEELAEAIEDVGEPSRVVDIVVIKSEEIPSIEKLEEAKKALASLAWAGILPNAEVAGFLAKMAEVGRES